MMALVMSSMGGIVFAQEVQNCDAIMPSATNGVMLYDIPQITADTEIFRRTPMIDGVIEDGEWDTYYTFETGGWSATTFADWDTQNVYVAAKSNRPLDFLTVLDCCDDGWFHGEDNYEFRATRVSDGALSLSVSRYESMNTKAPVATPVSPQEMASVELRSAKVEGVYMIEMRIPVALIPGFKLANGKKIGFQVALNASGGDSGWVPNNELGDTKQCIVVTKKFATLKPLELGFDLRDTVVAKGDELIGKFHLKNGGGEKMDVESFVIAGEGLAGEHLSSAKVRMDGLTAGQHVSGDYRSLVLSGMRVGSWALGAEVKSANSRLGSALVSFDVVEPFEIKLRLPDRDVRADAKDVTVGVVISNYRRSNIDGVAKVIFPTGWELWRGLDQRDFQISGKSNTAVSFKAKPPLGAIGDIPVRIDVICGNETKTVEGKFRVVNP
ncbi:MAG: hypothetical protein ABFD49_09105 [Armatimonadota bacterium]|nr:CBM9 family sugar-binding protein [bacterium]